MDIQIPDLQDQTVVEAASYGGYDIVVKEYCAMCPNCRRGNKRRTVYFLRKQTQEVVATFDFDDAVNVGDWLSRLTHV